MLTLRLCGSSALLKVVDMYEPQFGCHSIDKFGFRGRACVCKGGDCVYPKSGRIPRDTS